MCKKNRMGVEEKMIFKKSKQHLEETGWTYREHLLHSVHQSNTLIILALKSYIHGIFPCWYKADGPKTIIKMYHQIMKIHHIWKMNKDMKDKGEV